MRRSGGGLRSKRKAVRLGNLTGYTQVCYNHKRIGGVLCF